MHRNLQQLAREPYDLLIIGGGVNGMAAAWDASLRGLKVALVEKGDYGAQTSSATLKIVHGGLRYLQHLDFRRMRENIRERRLMLQLAPHLVEPISFVVPTRGILREGQPLLATAVLLNDLLSVDRNKGQEDPARRIPNGRFMLSKRECLDKVPGYADLKGINGGVQFYDASMYNSERLSLSFGLSAAEQGADMANYTEVIKLIRRGDRIEAARVKDLLTGDEFEIRADMILNMSGPWSDIVSALSDDVPPKRSVLRSKGIQLVAPSLSKDVGFAFPTTYYDPDAVITRSGRNFFVMPWRGVSLIGTTDTVYEGDPDDFSITAADVQEFIDDINTFFPAAQLKFEDVPFAFGGLRPITECNLESGSTVSRRYEISDHQKDLGLRNMISVIGVKYTTCRLLAEKVINRVFEMSDRTSPRVVTDRTPLVGGEIDQFEPYMADQLARRPERISEFTMRHLVRSYGTRSQALLQLAEQEPDLGATVPGSDEVILAEIAHAARHESAVHLVDAVLCRTDLGTKGHPGTQALDACAQLMAKELGWDAPRMQQEVEQTEKRLRFA